METLRKFLEFVLISAGEYKIRVYSLVTILIIFLVTKLILWLIRKTLFRQRKFSKLDKGSAYALFQIIRYIIWIIAIGLILEAIGIKVTLLIAGSAALLVGVGLGLNTDDISIIIPNSLITTNKVINWSHQTKKTRFRIDVGVAYGSDVDLVIKILEESAFQHPDISDRELTEARLVNFGNSSIDFQVLFFSKNIFRINNVKSDIRRIIIQKFDKNNIAIPFPQMDLHLKSNYTQILKKKE